MTPSDDGREPRPPSVSAALDGWRLVDEYVETVFDVGTARVEGHTAVYDDPALADAGAAAGLGDGPWRFFFVTRLQFDPPLVPGFGTASVYPSVVTESARAFADDLRSRGFVGVERGRRERTRTEAGDRLNLTRYTARYRPDEGASLDVEGWIGVWTRGGEFRLAGGAYPAGDLSPFRDGTGGSSTPSPAIFRDELLALIRSVD